MFYLSSVGRRLASLKKVLCTAAIIALVLLTPRNPGIATTSTKLPTGRIRIIYTNDTVGYLEPCGCGGRYIGGLARRATAISRLVSENPYCLIVDSGNISNTRANVDIVASLMSQMKYKAVGIGTLDLEMADEFFKSLARHNLAAVDTTTAELPGSTRPYIIESLNGVRVGIVSYGAQANDMPASSEVLERFYSTYRSARDSCDLLILLDQGEIVSKDWQERWGDRLGAPDIVIAGVTKMPLSQEEVVGKTHIVPTSVQGRAIGVIDVEIGTDKQASITVQRVTVDKNTAENPSIAKQINEFLLGVKPKVEPTASSSQYSPETCKTCHSAEYESWQRTEHARAVRTLADKNRMIGECLQCHSETYRRSKSAPVPTDKPMGVECVTCHSNVLPHSADGPARSARKKIAPALCLTCHTKERSPEYDPKTYKCRIIHEERP